MQKFKEFLTERYVNLFTPEEKKKWVDQVWDILQSSYAYAGGIKGNGFNSKEEMIAKIPFWKLNVRDGKVVTVKMYKDKDGRKTVASGTDKSKEGIKSYKEIVKQDLKNAYFEVSDKALETIKKLLGPEFDKYKIKFEDAQKKMPDDVIRRVDDFYYEREIGGEWHTKLMMGNIHAKKITPPIKQSKH